MMAANNVSSGVSCVPPPCGRTLDGGISGFAISHRPSGTIQLHVPRPMNGATTVSPRRTRSKGSALPEPTVWGPRAPAVYAAPAAASSATGNSSIHCGRRSSGFDQLAAKDTMRNTPE